MDQILCQHFPFKVPRHVTYTVQVKSIILILIIPNTRSSTFQNYYTWTTYDFIFRNNTCKACALPTYTILMLINVLLFSHQDWDFNLQALRSVLSYKNVDFSTNAPHLMITIYNYLDNVAASTLHIVNHIFRLRWCLLTMSYRNFIKLSISSVQA